MIGPKLPESWASPSIRRRRELTSLRKLIDDKATFWHRQFMERSLGPVPSPQAAIYARGMADAYSEAFHALSLMRGFPWA